MPQLAQFANVFTRAEDRLIVKLKERAGLSWATIATHFTGRTAGSLQVRYSRRLCKNPKPKKSRAASAGNSSDPALPLASPNETSDVEQIPELENIATSSTSSPDQGATPRNSTPSEALHGIKSLSLQSTIDKSLSLQFTIDGKEQVELSENKRPQQRLILRLRNSQISSLVKPPLSSMQAPVSSIQTRTSANNVPSSRLLGTTSGTPNLTAFMVDNMRDRLPAELRQTRRSDARANSLKHELSEIEIDQSIRKKVRFRPDLDPITAPSSVADIDLVTAPSSVSGLAELGGSTPTTKRVTSRNTLKQTRVAIKTNASIIRKGRSRTSDEILLAEASLIEHNQPVTRIGRPLRSAAMKSTPAPNVKKPTASVMKRPSSVKRAGRQMIPKDPNDDKKVDPLAGTATGALAMTTTPKAQLRNYMEDFGVMLGAATTLMQLNHSVETESASSAMPCPDVATKSVSEEDEEDEGKGKACLPDPRKSRHSYFTASC